MWDSGTLHSNESERYNTTQRTGTSLYQLSSAANASITRLLNRLTHAAY